MAINRREFLGLGLPALGGLGALGALGGMAAVGLTGREARAQDHGRQPLQAEEGEPAIREVRYYAAGPGYVKISTDDPDVFGWGEFTTVPDHGIKRAFVQWLSGLLIGVNPTRIEHIWQMMYRAHRNVRGGMTHLSIIGGLDMALYDLVGRLMQVPVYTLLGGPCRQWLYYYPNARAHKVTSHNLHYMVERPARVRPIAEAVRRTRERVGDNGFVMIDGHGKFTAQVAIQLCKMVEDQGVLFFEEVIPPESIEDLARVKAATTVPLAKGERLAGLWDFRRPLEGQWVDVVNPDLVRMGGISQMRKLGAVCEMYKVPIAPHATQSAVGLSATLHFSAAINNFLITEAYQHIVERNPYAKGLSFPDNGMRLDLPPGPGLGIEVDEDRLAAADADWEPRPLNRAYFKPDGSVADR